MIKDQTISNYLDKIKNPNKKTFGKYYVIFTGLTWARNLIDCTKCDIYENMSNVHVKTILI